jgi:hypothetical protein
MQPNDMLVHAVALSGRLEVLQLLVRGRHVHSPVLVSHYAAHSGSMSMLNWLRTQSWCVFDESTCAGAAQGGHLAALKHVRSLGCGWNEELITYYAAGSGSIEVVEWLRQQQGVQFDASSLRAAAHDGHIPMCAHLRSIGCEWDVDTCYSAIVCDHLDTLRWLREHGCPWDVRQICMRVANAGFIDILDYVIEQGEVLDAELLADALNDAGCGSQLQAAQWLRQHGAEWPTVLGFDEHERVGSGVMQ